MDWRRNPEEICDETEDYIPQDALSPPYLSTVHGTPNMVRSMMCRSVSAGKLGSLEGKNQTSMDASLSLRDLHLRISATALHRVRPLV